MFPQLEQLGRCYMQQNCFIFFSLSLLYQRVKKRLKMIKLKSMKNILVCLLFCFLYSSPYKLWLIFFLFLYLVEKRTHFEYKERLLYIFLWFFISLYYIFNLLSGNFLSVLLHLLSVSCFFFHLLLLLFYILWYSCSDCDWKYWTCDCCYQNFRVFFLFC